MTTRKELEKKIVDLEAELAQIKQILSICASCHKIREEKEWYPVADFLTKKFGIIFSHSICPECVKKTLPFVSYKK